MYASETGLFPKSHDVLFKTHQCVKNQMFRMFDSPEERGVA